jgi:hypothetical protein
MRRTFCLMLVATCLGCSGNADEEARKAKLAEEEARKKKDADEERLKVQAAHIQVEKLLLIARKFHIDQGRYPQVLRELAVTPVPDLKVTYCQPEALRDPWGQEFLYAEDGSKTMMAGGDGPDIYSKGNPAAPKEIGSWMRLK